MGSRGSVGSSTCCEGEGYARGMEVLAAAMGEEQEAEEQGWEVQGGQQEEGRTEGRDCKIGALAPGGSATSTPVR